MSLTQNTRTITTSLVLYFFVYAGSTVCDTYIDALFLSTYPRNWIPYLFLGKTVVILLLVFAVTPMISQGSQIVNSLMLMILALTIIISRLLSEYQIAGFPFALCLWLEALIVLIRVISLNAVTDAFDIRKFKSLLKWIDGTGGVGGLLIGLLIPVIISVSKLEVLLYVLSVFIFIAALCVWQLKPIAVTSKKSEGKRLLRKYPLFIYGAIAVFFNGNC